VLGPGHGRFHIRNNFIHADNQDDLLGPENHGRYPVSLPVEID
jgi:hypothetical protein